MAERGYLLGERAAAAVRDLTARRDGTPAGDPARVHGPVAGIVRVTSGTATDGWYPAQWQNPTSTGALSDGGDAWVRDPSGATLSNGSYYPAVRTGEHPTTGVSRWQTALNAGPTLSVATNVCPIRSSGGVVTGLKVERRTVYLPAGTVVGSPTCENNSAACCTTSGSGGNPSTVYVSCCPNALPVNLVATFASAACAAMDGVTVPLTRTTVFWIGYGYDNNGVPFTVLFACFGSDGGLWTLAVYQGHTNQGGVAGWGFNYESLKSGATGAPDSLTCDPFEWVVNGLPNGSIGPGGAYWTCGENDTIDVTITPGSVPPIIDEGTGLACCDNALPTTLTLTLPDTSEVTLTYNPSNQSWEGGIYAFYCGDPTEGSFGMLLGPLEGSAVVTSAACDPPYWEFTDGGDVYTVTE